MIKFIRRIRERYRHKYFARKIRRLFKQISPSISIEDIISGGPTMSRPSKLLFNYEYTSDFKVNK